MNKGFRVRCINDSGRALAGCFAAALTATGAVIAWRIERARCYESSELAVQVVRKLASKFPGTQWQAERV